MKKILLSLLLCAPAFAQTFSYTTTACSNGASTALGVSVTAVCAVAYSTNGPNAASRVHQLYYPTALGGTNTRPVIAYLHGGGDFTGTTALNWMDPNANPAGYANLAALCSCNVIALDYTLSTNTANTRYPAAIQDVDCDYRALTHNRGTTGFPGNGQLFQIGSSYGGQAALQIHFQGPLVGAPVAANCEWTDSYAIAATFANSPETDAQAAALANNLTNSATVSGYVVNYIGCASGAACGTDPTAFAASPINMVVSGKSRVMIYTGQTDNWIAPALQGGAMPAKYLALSPPVTIPYVNDSTCGHLCDEQTGGIFGKIQQMALAFFFGTASPLSSGSVRLAGSTF